MNDKVQKYRKIPVVIEAIQLTRQNKMDCVDFCGRDNVPEIKDGALYIHTLEGDMKASEGDYIIKGVKGEFYPCKPDIFEKTYEKVN